MSKAPQLLTRRELARAIKVSPETVSRWVHNGKIPIAVYANQVMRFDLDEVLKALRANKSA